MPWCVVAARFWLDVSYVNILESMAQQAEKAPSGSRISGQYDCCFYSVSMWNMMMEVKVYDGVHEKNYQKMYSKKHGGLKVDEVCAAIKKATGENNSDFKITITRKNGSLEMSVPDGQFTINLQIPLK